MKNIFLTIGVLCYSFSIAQNVLNASSPEALRAMRNEGLTITSKGDTISDVKKPLAYGYIETNDILWSKTVWEIIDLNEKLNQPYYYSSNSIVQNSKSLYQVLFDAVMSGKIKEVYDDEEFITKLTPDQIKQRVSVTRESDYLIDLINEGKQITEEDKKRGTDIYQTDTKKVKLIKVKGMWYVDKRLGELRYRLLGLAPMGPDPQTMGQAFNDKDEVIDLFWVWYPDVREVLVNSTIFNPRNNMSSVSYDDVLNARRFSSVIYKTENGFGSGNLEEYLPKDAVGQMEEGNRIRESILQVENDLWNY